MVITVAYNIRTRAASCMVGHTAFPSKQLVIINASLKTITGVRYSFKFERDTKDNQNPPKADQEWEGGTIQSRLDQILNLLPCVINLMPEYTP